MTANQPTPDVEGVLAAHQRLLDGPGSCWRGDWPPAANDVTWPAHLAAALEPLIREREAKALEDAASHFDGPCTEMECTSPSHWAAAELRDRAAEHRKDT